MNVMRDGGGDEMNDGFRCSSEWEQTSSAHRASYTCPSFVLA